MNQSSLSKVLNDVEVMMLPDNTRVKQDNTTDINRLVTANKYQMYNLLRAQMDGGVKYTITNNINLLKISNGITYNFYQGLR